MKKTSTFQWLSVMFLVITATAPLAAYSPGIGLPDRITGREYIFYARLDKARGNSYRVSPVLVCQAPESLPEWIDLKVYPVYSRHHPRGFPPPITKETGAEQIILIVSRKRKSYLFRSRDYLAIHPGDVFVPRFKDVPHYNNIYRPARCGRSFSRDRLRVLKNKCGFESRLDFHPDCWTAMDMLPFEFYKVLALYRSQPTGEKDNALIRYLIDVWRTVPSITHLRCSKIVSENVLDPRARKKLNAYCDRVQPRSPPTSAPARRSGKKPPTIIELEGETRLGLEN